MNNTIINTPKMVTYNEFTTRLKIINVRKKEFSEFAGLSVASSTNWKKKEAIPLWATRVLECLEMVKNKQTTKIKTEDALCSLNRMIHEDENFLQLRRYIELNNYSAVARELKISKQAAHEKINKQFLVLQDFADRNSLDIDVRKHFSLEPSKKRNKVSIKTADLILEHINKNKMITVKDISKILHDKDEKSIRNSIRRLVLSMQVVNYSQGVYCSIKHASEILNKYSNIDIVGYATKYYSENNHPIVLASFLRAVYLEKTGEQIPAELSDGLISYTLIFSGNFKYFKRNIIPRGMEKRFLTREQIVQNMLEKNPQGLTKKEILLRYLDYGVISLEQNLLPILSSKIFMEKHGIYFLKKS